MAELKHYGTPRRSGRYPWGSGEDGYQRTSSFLGDVEKLEKQGLSEVEIAKGFGISTTELRKKRSIAVNEERARKVSEVARLKEKGLSNVAIGKKMGLNESSVRALQDESLKEKAKVTSTIANVLKDNISKEKYIDIGLGTEVTLGISRTKFNNAVAMLEEEGYFVDSIPVKQMGTGKTTWMKVIAPPGTDRNEVMKNRERISTVYGYFENGGRTALGIETPTPVSRNRILVKYKEDGGINKDGVIELRRGVEDISLGNPRYAQVRISVDGTHFMKGMAMHVDNIPDEYDIIYNTNKPRGTSDDDVFKPMKDQDNPFKATIRQKHYIGSDGKDHLSALNIVGSTPGSGEEGSWGKWSRTISSQILSKQTPALAKKQLGQAYDMKKEEFDEIMSLTNPAVKKRLLETFANGADSDAVHLKAAALPRQSHFIILPINSLKENEVYAPKFNDGEPVVLIRHPHGGIFEIPELMVNNKNPEAKSVMRDAIDAIGINPKVASRLSGADFDGDTVIVIPNKNRDIVTHSPIKSVMNFDPSASYPKYDGMPIMSEATKQRKMGEISNLITDMTIKGANDDEIARAVRHSMVVIDAVKHELNHTLSYQDENIAQLKLKYQGSVKGGAATLISRAKSPTRVPERKEGVLIVDPVTGKKKRLYVDPETGEKLYTETGKKDTFKIVVDPVTGKKRRVYGEGTEHLRTTEIHKMDKEKDAYALSSGTKMEEIYADHANLLKALANKARKAAYDTEDTPYSPSARATYKAQVDYLKASLNEALRNKPLERQAQLIANKIVAQKKRANPDMPSKELKKIKAQALEEARRRTGAKRTTIVIKDIDWEAIQAGALSNSLLSQILLNTDLDSLKQRAMPRTYVEMSPARVSRAKAMSLNGYTTAEIAQALGVSTSTIDKVIR